MGGSTSILVTLSPYLFARPSSQTTEEFLTSISEEDYAYF